MVSMIAGETALRRTDRSEDRRTAPGTLEIKDKLVEQPGRDSELEQWKTARESVHGSSSPEPVEPESSDSEEPEEAKEPHEESAAKKLLKFIVQFDDADAEKPKNGREQEGNDHHRSRGRRLIEEEQDWASPHDEGLLVV